MLATFFLTVLVDLTVVIEIRMLLAVFLFMRKMIRFSGVNVVLPSTQNNGVKDADAIEEYMLPADVEVFEITGPLFFGAAYKFRDAMKFIEKNPKVLIIRMRQVPIIDATGIKTLQEVFTDWKHRGTKLILCEIKSEQVLKELKTARLEFAIGRANLLPTLAAAVERSQQILQETSGHYRRLL